MKPIEPAASPFVKGGYFGAARAEVRSLDGAQRYPTKHPTSFRRTVAWITLVSFIGQPLAASAEIIAAQDAAAGKRPTVDVTANGLPLVQIATPSGAGVSHNQYSRFNVDQQGAILNNSRATTLTQQAGYVSANPNLANGSARIILNEVTGTGRSQLNGYTEVAGQQAEVIIANPNGITCNGCGFINASRGVLTTGAPVMGTGGSLDTFRVTGGDIQIGSGGMNGSNISQLDLIARSVKVNGELWANDLNVITGANQVDYSTLGVQIIQGTGTQPTVGIDVAQLGGMYANKIRMVGTEAGVGVNSLGNLSAQSGDFTLDNAGQITLAGSTTASGNLDFRSDGDIDNSGVLYGQGNAHVYSARSIANSGLLTAQGNLTLNANIVDSNGTLGAGIDDKGKATQAGSLSINTTNQTTATGSNVATRDISVAASAIDLSNSSTQALNSVSLTASAGNIDLNHALTQAIAGSLSATATGTIDNSAGYLEAGGGIKLSANSLDNAGGAIKNLGVNDNLVITATQDIINTSSNGVSGFIGSNGNFTIDAAALNNSSGKLYAYGDLTLDRASATADNSAGEISSSGNTTLNLASINNQGGLLLAGRDLNLTTRSSNGYSGFGTVAAYGNNTITLQGDFTNSAGNIFTANANLTLEVIGDLTNQTALDSLGLLSVSANNISNTSTGTFNAGATTLDAANGSITNDGRIEGNTVTVSSTDLTNYADIFGDIITLNASHNLTNQGAAAVIGATDTVNLWVTNQLSNIGGAEIFSLDGNINIAKDSVMDAGGNFVNMTQWILNGDSTISKSSVIEAGHDLNIAAVVLDNTRPVDIVSSTHVSPPQSRSAPGLYPVPAGFVPVAPPGAFRTPSNWILTSSSAPVQSGFFAQEISGLNTAVKTFQVTGGEPLSGVASVYYEDISPAPFAATEYYRTGIDEYGFSYQIPQIIPDSTIVSSVWTFTWPGYQYRVTLTSGSILTFDGLSRQGMYYDVSYYPGYNPNVNIHPSDLFELGAPTLIYHELSRATRVTTTTDQLGQPLVAGAEILAAGSMNLNIRTALNNTHSTIAAGGDLTISGTTTSSASGATPVSHAMLTNTATNLNRVVTTSVTSNLGGWNPCGGPVWDPNSDRCWVTTTWDHVPAVNSTPIHTISSSVTAGGAFTTNAGSITNTTENGTNAPITGATLGSTVGDTSVGGSGTNAAAITLPTSGLYTLQPQPDQQYLVVTDPRFTDYKTFISSDYMLSRLTLDPALTQKRLGDGFYEQRLITDQIIQQTGKRYLGEYASVEEQIRVLMDSGVAAAQELKLTPGIALTSEQIATLRSDIVWMVEEDVDMPDGSKVSVLVPRVYLGNLDRADLRPEGALIAAGSIDIVAASDLINSGRIVGGRSAQLTARNIFNSGNIFSDGNLGLYADNDITNRSGSIRGNNVWIDAGRNLTNSTTTQEFTVGNASLGGSNTLIGSTGMIAARNSLDMRADGDISIIGAAVEAGGNASIAAGNMLTLDTIVTTATANSNTGSFAYNTSRTTHLGSSIETGGNLIMSSGDDMRLVATKLDSGQNTSLVSGGNLVLDSAVDSASMNSRVVASNSDATARTLDETVRGTTLNAGGNITLAATHLATEDSDARSDGKGNITLNSATLNTSQGRIAIAADADVNIGITEEKHESFSEMRSSSKGMFTTTKRTERTETARTDAIGSSISGDTIAIQSGNDLNLTGSRAVAEGDITLAAMNDINISAATNLRFEDHYLHETTTGLQFNGNPFNVSDHGPDITVQDRLDASIQSEAKSLIQTRSGNITAVAGNNLIVTGSDLKADAQQGSEASRSAGGHDNEHHDDNTDEQTKGQITLAAGNTVALLAGQDIVNQSHSVTIVKDPNFFTKQRYTLEDTQSSLVNFGSTLNGEGLDVQSGADIVLQAAQLNAGQSGITLDAGRDIQLLAAYDQQSHTRHETLSTDGIGIKADGTPDDTATRRMNNTHEEQTTTGIVTQLQSQGDIKTRSGGDTRIEASQLQAEGAIGIEAQGILTLAAVKDSTYVNVAESSSSMPWQSASGHGEVTDTLKLANISAGEGLTVDAKGGIEIDIPEVKTPTAPAQYDEQGNLIPPVPLTPEEKAAQRQAALNQQLDKLASQPGQEWIAQLAKQDNVRYNEVKLAAEHWDYSHEGLTPEAAAVVVIVVTYFTAGSASTAASGIAGAGTATSAALAVGMTTLASQAAVSFINNKGDLGKTLDDMGKSENIRALATAMVTAGALQGLNQTLNLQNINAKSGFGQQLGKNLIDNTASAVLDHAINGGDLQDKLELALKNAFIDTGAAQGANQIGDMYVEGDLNAFTHKLAHAIAGCAAGAAKAGDCSSGALGAVVGEITAELYAPDSTAGMTPKQIEDMQRDTINFSKMMAGIAAAITGGDAEAINLAASTGGNAAENNLLMHIGTYDKEKANCQGSNSAECQAINRMAGVRSTMPVDDPSIPDSKVVANLDENGKVVSYTLVARDTNQPRLIMEPTDYAMYSNAGRANQGLMTLSPQWSLDIGSGMAYMGQGDTTRAFEHMGYVVSSPEYWGTMATGVVGGALAMRGGPGAITNAANRVEGTVSSATPRQTMATGSEWYEYYAGKYGAQNVDWVSGSGRTIAWPSELPMPTTTSMIRVPPPARSGTFVRELESVTGPRPTGAIAHHTQPLGLGGVDSGALNGSWVYSGPHTAGHGVLNPQVNVVPYGTQIRIKPQ